MLAKSLLISFDQALPVARFFRLHLFEHFGGSSVGFAKSLGKITIDAAILFFEKDRKCKYFAFRQALKSLGHRRFFPNKFSKEYNASVRLPKDAGPARH